MARCLRVEDRTRKGSRVTSSRTRQTNSWKMDIETNGEKKRKKQYSRSRGSSRALVSFDDLRGGSTVQGGGTVGGDGRSGGGLHKGSRPRQEPTLGRPVTPGNGGWFPQHHDDGGFGGESENE